MIMKYIYKISLFLLAIFISLALLPNLNVYIRPNFILIFLVILLVEESLLFNLPFWFIGGIGLDIWRGNILGASSFSFIGILFLTYILSKFVDLREKETSLILGGFFIIFYHLCLFVVFKIALDIFKWNVLINGLITLILFILIFFFIQKLKNYNNEKI